MTCEILLNPNTVIFKNLRGKDMDKGQTVRLANRKLILSTICHNPETETNWLA